MVLGPVGLWHKTYDTNITEYTNPFNDEMFTVFLHRNTYYSSGIYSLLSSLDWFIWSLVFIWFFIMFILIAIFYSHTSSKYKLSFNTMRILTHSYLMLYSHPGIEFITLKLHHYDASAS